MIGKKYGMLTVIEDSGLRDNCGGKIFLCKCDCGIIKNVTWKLLKNETKPRSCGCSRKKRSKEIFESKYEKTNGCWEWTGNLTQNGYGKIGTNKTAHREAYKYKFGEIPKGKQVCHKCDNRKCVNPKHLFLGSCSDNLKDMTDKGRRARGSKIASSLLDEEKVLEIRKKRLSGYEYKALANEYGIGWYTVRCICKNRQWQHVPLGEECKAYVSPLGGHKK